MPRARRKPFVGAAAGNKNVKALVPSWNLVATQDLKIPAKTQDFMAERAGSHTVKVKASHAVSVSHPGKVTDLIEEAARTVR
ncbi:pimeloyl-ACP methyl ester carboxylesterase [Streptomyces umbrinus]|uniref:hypothetical protein n=1 Tax=Streptomyces umbrinus TaxID=67370 RepID=UPI00167CB591|nr:hypothetical protein [Streptomyces umbrinus]MCR3724879.1 pimeloyl-ACP methyl ester carboxylesterase [Streptomyces umbrinus]MCX4563888.1 hypothetical protein [Streptomyces phaeochromogenes]GHH60992.1 hypothetical protein GCM10018775_74830 [Streptomyces umbrinus]